MTKEEIRSWLQTQLNTPTWNALKTSFIGRELIEYAATVIHMSEEQKRSIQNNQYPDTADIDSLLLYSYNRDFPVDLHRPAYIKISDVQSTIIRPYHATITSGTIFFTNTDYITDTNEYYLYQGTVKTMYTEQMYSLPTYTTENFELFYDVDEGSYFVKLGENAKVDSVIAYVNDGAVKLISEYDSLRENSESYVMKLKRGFDRSLNLYFGNGTWGKKYDSSNTYQIIWLDSTQSSFDTDGLTLVRSDGVSVPFTILSTDEGESNDIEYTRSQVKAKIAELSVAATESQIIALCKKDPSVLDCIVSVDGTNSNHVKVWVKPTDITDTVFDDVQDSLNLHGEIVTQYEVVAGSPLYFNIRLTQIASVTENVLNEVRTLLESELSYENIPYVSSLSSIQINEMISYLTYGNVTASIVFSVYVEEASNEILLPTRPYRGTIAIYKDGVQIGWDTEGMLYGAFEPQTVTLDNLFLVDAFFISCGSSKVVSYNRDFTIFADNTGRVPFNNLLTALYDEDRMLARFAESIQEFVINEVFEDGQYSIQRNPTTLVTSYRTISSTLNFENSVYVKNVGVFKVTPVEEEASNTRYYLYRYDINNNLNITPNFSILISTEADLDIISVTQYNGDMYIFFKQGLYYIENFTSPQFSEQLRIDNIPELTDMSNIEQVVMNNTLLILTKTMQEGNYYYEFKRASGFSVDNTTPKRFILRTQFQTICTFLSETEVTYKVLESNLTSLIFIDETNKILYSAHDGIVEELAHDGDEIEAVTRVGILNYSNSSISIEGRVLEDITVEYESSEPLNNIGEDVFPVLNEIIV